MRKQTLSYEIRLILITLKGFFLCGVSVGIIPYTITCETISPANICKLLIVAPAFKSTIYLPSHTLVSRVWQLLLRKLHNLWPHYSRRVTQLEACHNETYSTWRPTLIAVVVVTHCQITATSLLAFSGGIPSVSCDIIYIPNEFTSFPFL